MTANERTLKIVFKGGVLLLWLQPLARVELSVGLLLAGCCVIVLVNRFAAAVVSPAVRVTAWWTVRPLAMSSTMRTRR